VACDVLRPECQKFDRSIRKSFTPKNLVRSLPQNNLRVIFVLIFWSNANSGKRAHMPTHVTTSADVVYIMPLQQGARLSPSKPAILEMGGLPCFISPPPEVEPAPFSDTLVIPAVRGRTPSREIEDPGSNHSSVQHSLAPRAQRNAPPSPPSPCTTLPNQVMDEMTSEDTNATMNASTAAAGVVAQVATFISKERAPSPAVPTKAAANHLNGKLAKQNFTMNPNQRAVMWKPFRRNGKFMLIASRQPPPVRKRQGGWSETGGKERRKRGVRKWGGTALKKLRVWEQACACVNTFDVLRQTSSCPIDYNQH